MFGVQPLSGCPCTSTVPLVGAVNPDRILSSVDFPDPEGPSSAQIMPDSTAKSIGAMI
jgi:hypothetical protein